VDAVKIQLRSKDTPRRVGLGAILLVMAPGLFACGILSLVMVLRSGIRFPS